MTPQEQPDDYQKQYRAMHPEQAQQFHADDQVTTATSSDSSQVKPVKNAPEQPDSQVGDSPAEALRQHYKQEIEYVLETSDETGEVRITYADGHSEIKPAKVLLLDDIMHFVDAYVTAYAATVEREARIDQTKFLQKAQRKFGRIDFEAALYELQDRDRLAALQGPTQGDSNTSEEASSTQ